LRKSQKRATVGQAWEVHISTGSFDVAIVGGGLGASALAISLVKRGVRVAIQPACSIISSAVQIFLPTTASARDSSEKSRGRQKFLECGGSPPPS